MSDGMECGCADACFYYEGEMASICEQDWRSARKDHKCCECRRIIRKGERYQYISMLFDGSWDHYKVCKECYAIGRDYFCGCYPIGDLAAEVWEVLGVDIITGEIRE